MRFDPVPLKDSRCFRVGPLQLEQRDRGSVHGEWRLHYRENYGVLSFSRPDFSLGLCKFDGGRLSLSLFGLWVKLPWRVKSEVPSGDVMQKWGFSYFMGGIHLNWGSSTRIVYVPWDFQHVDSEHKVLMRDGSWTIMPRWRMGEAPPETRLGGPRWCESYPYRYMLRSGEVQERVATVTVERRVWRRRCLPAWLPLFQLKATTIDVEFNDEVGERTGSWKGGCTGCGYDMKPGETPLQTLRRMEQERRFN